MITKNKNGIIWLVVIATVFGLLAGAVGAITSRSFFGNGSFFWGELNFTDENLERPSVVIRGAKKVVVEQDEKINETISAVEDSLLYIYSRKATSSPAGLVGLNNFYKPSDRLGMALILTSDGWVVSDSLDFLSGQPAEKDLSQYIFLDRNQNAYRADKAAFDPLSGFYFFHLQSRDLPVLNLAGKDSLSPGKTVFAINKNREIAINNISSSDDMGQYSAISSDYYYRKIKLAKSLGDDFYSSFAFDISGAVVFLVDSEGDIIPSDVFSSVFDSLFSDGEIKRASLGLEYADLSRFYYEGDEDVYSQGALVLPTTSSQNLPWIVSGIEVGDVIKSVDGTALNKNNNLFEILRSRGPGDKIDLNIIRDFTEMEIGVELVELK